MDFLGAQDTILWYEYASEGGQSLIKQILSNLKLVITLNKT